MDVTSPTSQDAMAPLNAAFESNILSMDVTFSTFQSPQASQHVATSVPVSADPLFRVLDVYVPLPFEQSTSSRQAVLPMHMPVTVAVTASQHVARSVPVSADPLFWVLAAVVPSPFEQSTFSLLAVLPVHMPVTVVGPVAAVLSETAAPADAISTARTTG